MVYKSSVSILLKSKPFLIFLLLSVAISSCTGFGGKRTKKRVFKLGNHKAWMERLDTSDPYFKRRKFNHPYRMHPVVLRTVLESLRYKGLGLLSKEKRVFSKPVESDIIVIILKALAKARPREVVKFSYYQKGGKKTTGDLFIVGSKVNWRFYEIRGKQYSRHGSRNWLDTWKLVLNNKQKYHGVSGLMGKSAVKNWIVTPLRTAKLSSGAGKSRDPAKKMGEREFEEELLPLTEDSIKESLTDPNMKLEKALSRLKRLRKRDLITEEEYKSQKAELLRKSFQ